MRVGRLIAFALLALAGLAPVRAADEKPAPPKTLDELDRRIGETFAKLKIPGASVAVIENNQVVLTKGYGFSDVGARKQATPETVFRAGSISKNFVGVAVMMLVEEGKLDLNAKLADLAPEIKFVNPWEATDPVRLVHLMEHTTGFDDIRFSQYLFDGKDMPLKQAIDLYGPYVSRWKPGTYPAYSNAPPVIAAYIVEKASGQSWADFTRTRIFEPLGMTSAHWVRTPDIDARLSKSYRSDGVTQEPYVDIPGKPAGSLNVTPRDLAKFALMMVGRGTYNGKTLLRSESVDRIETPQSTLASRSGLKLGYGLGNLAVPREKGIFHGHDGGIDGFLATYLYEPSKGAGLVAMVNIPNGDALQVMELIVSYLERDWSKSTPTPIAQSPEALDKLTGIYKQAAPRVQMLAPLEEFLGTQNARVENGKLVIEGIERIPVGPLVFQRPDRSAPTVVFVPTAAGAEMLTATGARRLTSQLEVIAKSAFVILYAVCLTISLLYFIVWFVSLFLGRLSERGGVLVRAIPFLTILALPAFLGTLLMALGADTSLMILGTPSTTAVAIYGLSLSVPLLGAFSLFEALAPRSGTTILARGLAFANGALALIAATYLWQFGWVGLKTWI